MLGFRKIAQVVTVLVFTGLSLVLAAGMWMGKGAKTPETQTSAVTGSEMKLTDIEFTEMEQGKRFWTLHASEAAYFHDQQKTYLKTVHLTFYLDGEEGEIHLDSNEGVLHAGTKNIELRNGVRADLPRGYVITTDSADYDHQERTVRSDRPIRLSGPGADINGERWEYRITERRSKVAGVKASLVGAKIKLEKN